MRRDRPAAVDAWANSIAEAPLGYLTQWRMQKAARLMLDGDATLAAIARAVGYETESAFGKAFRRHMGTSPGEYRKSPVLSHRQGHGGTPSPGAARTPPVREVLARLPRDGQPNGAPPQAMITRSLP